mgnify:CR=1 FL=1
MRFCGKFLILGMVFAVATGAGVYLAIPYLWQSGPMRDLTTVIGDPKRGKYVARLGGCFACHTDVKNNGIPMAGGRVIKTPFGDFRTPNITSDSETGIGGWSLADFMQAMTNGLRPDGNHYYPAFPYASYSKMNTKDIADLKAYLDTVPPAYNEIADHDLRFPFNIRRGLSVWKLLHFSPQAWANNLEKSKEWNRGAYIVNGPGHCVECHTPRTLMGGLDTEHHLKGAAKGPNGERIPDISANSESGIGNWSNGDFLFLLKMGLTPEGDVVGGAMADVVQSSTAHYSKQDLKAVIKYLKDSSTPRRTHPYANNLKSLFYMD